MDQEEEDISLLPQLLIAERQNDHALEGELLKHLEEHDEQAFPPMTEEDKLHIKQAHEIIATAKMDSVQHESTKEGDATAVNIINDSATEDGDNASANNVLPEVDGSANAPYTSINNNSTEVEDGSLANHVLPVDDALMNASFSNYGKCMMEIDDNSVDSSVAKHLEKKRGTENIFKNIEEHKKATCILTAALKKEEGWKHVVVLVDIPAFEKMITVDQAVKLYKQLLLLKHAITYAMEHPEVSWKGTLIKTATLYDFDGLRSARSLERTFAAFKKHSLKLPHPNICEVDSMKKTLWNTTSNHFLEIYPNLKQKFLSYSRENLRRFSVDLMHHFVNYELLPQVKNEIRFTLREKKNEIQNNEVREDDEEEKIIKSSSSSSVS
jgi:hypothetical protein